MCLNYLSLSKEDTSLKSQVFKIKLIVFLKLYVLSKPSISFVEIMNGNSFKVNEMQ